MHVLLTRPRVRLTTARRAVMGALVGVLASVPMVMTAPAVTAASSATTATTSGAPAPQAASKHRVTTGGAARPSAQRQPRVATRLAPRTASRRSVAAATVATATQVTPGGGTTPGRVSAFAGVDLTGKKTLFTSGCPTASTYPCDPSQDSAPPDTQVAVGPTAVVEVVNSVMYVYDRTGSLLPSHSPCPAGYPGSHPTPPFSLLGCNPIDLNDFAAAQINEAETDARIWYDAADDRFILSMLVFDSVNSNGSRVELFSTETGDPMGYWDDTHVVFSSSNDGFLRDQPQIGMSSDKIIMTWNQFSQHNPCAAPGGGSVSAPCFNGSQIAVLQKSDQLDPQVPSVRMFTTPVDPSRFGLSPALATTAGATGYVFYNNSNPYCGPAPAASCPDPQHVNVPAGGRPVGLNLLSVTGTPAGGLNFSSDTSLHAAPFVPTVLNATTGEAPAAAQPTPSGQSTPPPTIDSGDDRLLGVELSNGVAWMTAEDTCPTDSARACSRYFAVSVAASCGASAAPCLAQSFDLNDSSPVSYSSFDAAVMVDPQGHVFTAWNRSGPSGNAVSTSRYPSEEVAQITTGGTLTGAPAMSAPDEVVTGASYYDCTPSCANVPGVSRWGDYSGASQDPLHPGDVWFATEYANTGSSPSNWGTEVGRWTLSAPSISAVAPVSGPISGGTAVTITGSDLILPTGSTTVTFGGAGATIAGSPAPAPDQITVTTPGHAAGIVTVVATTGFGADTPTGAVADKFLYTQRGRYTAVTPVRIDDTRSSSMCRNNSVSCPNAGNHLGPMGSVNVTVTGSGVPTSASAVVLNVTAVGPTQGSLFTVAPAGVSRPFASSLNFPPGATIANLVEVPVGAAGQVTITNDLGTADAVVDLEGYVDPSLSGSVGKFNPVPPVRIDDTREGSSCGPAPGTLCQHAGSHLGPGGIITVQVSGTDGLPATGIGAVVLNLTAVDPTQDSLLRVWPADQSTVPVVSNLNFVAGATLPNRVVVPVSPTGAIKIRNDVGTVDVIVDVNGWFNDGTVTGPVDALYNPLAPARIADTRSGSGMPNSGQTLGPNSSIVVQVSGAGGVPAIGASPPPKAVVLNVTAVWGSAPSYVTVYPGDLGTTVPLASDLNFGPGATIPNCVVVKISPTDGTIRVYNSQGSVNVVIDVAGWYA